MCGDRLQIQLQALKEGQGAFRAHQQAREVRRGLHQLIEVVATDAAQQFRKALRDLPGLPLTQGRQSAQAFGVTRVMRRLADPARLVAADLYLGYACYDTEDFQIGYRSFLAKTKPQFKGR